MPDLLARVMMVILLLLSLCVHEWAHAWSASKLGDDTAERAGRLTLNPFAHADLIGTIILPLLLVPFGWAKPVPVDPSRFRPSIRTTTGMAITASAGPLANIALATITALLFGILARVAPGTIEFGTPIHSLLAGGYVGGRWMWGLLQMNVFLALFNMLPVPPLDGSRIVDGLMPLRFRAAWQAFTRFAPFLLIGLILYGGRVIAGPAEFLIGLLAKLISTIA